MSRSGFNNTMKLSFKLILHRIKGHNKPWNKASSSQSIKHKKTHSSHFFMTYMCSWKVSISLACFYRTSYPSFSGRVCRSAPPINVPLLLVLLALIVCGKHSACSVDKKGSSMNVASGVTACRTTSIHSSSGVRTMFYSKLVEYLTSCSWPGPCPDTYQLGLPFLLVLYLTCPDQADQEFPLVSYTSSSLHVEQSRLLAFRMKKNVW